jgi:hypothetical protein
MEFNDNEHVYRVTPDILGIKRKYDLYLAQLEDYKKDPDNVEKPEEIKPVIVHMKGVNALDRGTSLISSALAFDNHTKEKAREMVAKMSYAEVDSRILKIENLVCGKKEITTYMQLLNDGPRELADWIAGAVYSTEVLMECEIKN